MAVHPWHPPVCTGAGTFGHQEGSGLALLAARKDGGTRQKLQRDEKWAQPTRPALVQWRHAKTAEAQVDVHAAAFQAMALRHALRSKVNLAAVAMPSCKRRGRHGALRAGIHACQPRGMDGRPGRSGLPTPNAPRVTADCAVQAILSRHQAVAAGQLLASQGGQLFHLAVGWALGGSGFVRQQAGAAWASWGGTGMLSVAARLGTFLLHNPLSRHSSALRDRITGGHLLPLEANAHLQVGPMRSAHQLVGGGALRGILRHASQHQVDHSLRSMCGFTATSGLHGLWPLLSWQ